MPNYKQKQMAQEWTGKTFGNGWMHRHLVTMLKIVDIRILYVFSAIFIVPVCLAVRPSRGIIYRYFRQRHGYGRLRSAWKTYTNHCLFAQVVLDKFAMYAGRRFRTKLVGYENFLRLAAQPEGFIQLSAHVGNYEIAGYTLVAETKTFNALVYAGEKATVMDNRSKIFERNNLRMIAIRPDMSHLFEIDSALRRGETVSMPADRINGSPKYIELDLLGAKARFPKGPFSVATMRGLDVLAVNTMKTSTLEYTVCVTPLHYDKTALRARQTEELAAAYVAELESIMRRYPAQWYNYFDFWAK